MQQSRAQHSSCLIQYPKTPEITYVVVAGGFSVETHNDLFLKKKTQTYHDSNLVELFNIQTKKWKVFSACLCIARH